MTAAADAIPDRSRSLRSAELLVAVLWLAAVVAATMQQGISHQNNNFLIFRAASLHLMKGADLYAAYPSLHADMFKYSPAFAVLFLPLAVVPFALAMFLWNALNAGVLYVAIGRVLSPHKATVARAIVFLDMLGSLQNVQSNALVAGLMIFTFAWYERDRPVLGTVGALIGTAIKVFPLAAVSFAVFHRRKLAVAATTALGFVAIVFLPLLVTSPASLLAQYQSWHAIESQDALARGFTVMEMVEILFRQGWPNWPQQLGGTLLLVAPPLIRRERWGDYTFRLDYLCSVLIYCIIFNHQSESPTFVIGAAGAAVWFASLNQRTWWDWALFAFVVVCTILASSDAMPHSIQRALFDPYHFKTVPLIVLWVVLQVRLWRVTLDRREQWEQRERNG